MTRKLILCVVVAVSLCSTVFANNNCPVADRELKSALIAAANPSNSSLASAGLAGAAGGLFDGTRMWASVVNRDGEVCATVASTADPTQVWPGSQAIAKAKAYTGNAFSLDTFALSSARLYTFTQPGHSLWSLGQSNLFDPEHLATPDDRSRFRKSDLAGGLIFFGGGVPIYRNGRIVGGLGISGDTSCADHEIAKRVRHLLNLNPAGGPGVDDIVYAGDPPANDVFRHPICLNTYRNGVFIGTEASPTGY